MVLTIAGFDPSSGAGVTADIKTMAAHGCYGIACITALTVQSTRGVRRVEPLPGKLIAETLEELAADIEFQAVHIGMLGSAEVVRVVAEFLSRRKARNVVLDPVLLSSSGALLLEPAAIEAMKTRLFPLVNVITPNVDEASALTGLTVSNANGMRAAAKALHSAGVKAVVITGGHLSRAVDLLSIDRSGKIVQELFESQKIRSKATHGTGCAFSTALACRLAQGLSLGEGVRLAKAYVAGGISKAYPLGHGTGPVNHFWGAKLDPPNSRKGKPASKKAKRRRGR